MDNFTFVRISEEAEIYENDPERFLEKKECLGKVGAIIPNGTDNKLVVFVAIPGCVTFSWGIEDLSYA
jgi:hypothetical protein